MIQNPNPNQSLLWSNQGHKRRPQDGTKDALFPRSGATPRASQKKDRQFSWERAMTLATNGVQLTFLSGHRLFSGLLTWGLVSCSTQEARSSFQHTKGDIQESNSCPWEGGSTSVYPKPNLRESQRIQRTNLYKWFSLANLNPEGMDKQKILPSSPNRQEIQKANEVKILTLPAGFIRPQDLSAADPRANRQPQPTRSHPHYQTVGALTRKRKTQEVIRPQCLLTRFNRGRQW